MCATHEEDSRMVAYLCLALSQHAENSHWWLSSYSVQGALRTLCFLTYTVVLQGWITITSIWKVWKPRLTGVCGLLRVLQSDSGTGGVGSQARLGSKFPSLLGMSSALGLLGSGTDPLPLPPGFCHCARPPLGIPRNELCSSDFNLSRQCRLATILQ